MITTLIRARFLAWLLFFCVVGGNLATAQSGGHGQAGTHTVASDSSHRATSHESGEMTPPEEMLNILEHKVVNTPAIHEWPFPAVHFPENWIVRFGGFQLNFSLNRHLIYLLFSGLLTIILMMIAARQNTRNRIPKGYGNMIEAVIVYLRDEVARPFLGHNADKYMPLLLTFFFFIAITNLIGLLPFGATATGNINVTAGLALVTLSMMIFGGMKANGILGYWKGLVPHGIPWPLYFILFPIELIGIITKPFALTVRLFANMLSGGLVIGAFYALIFGMDTLVIAPVSILFLLFMSLLKLFVCVLQAFIFTMLSSFFIGMSVHQEH